MFCFDDFENIASYPIALYMRKDFALKADVDAIAQQLLEAGFFVKWESDSRIEGERKSPYIIPLQLTVTHISAALIFLLGCGLMASTSAFAVESYVYWKLKGQGKMKRTIWIYLEQFLDGRRNYLKNVPQRLQKSVTENEDTCSRFSVEKHVSQKTSSSYARRPKSI